MASPLIDAVIAQAIAANDPERKAAVNYLDTQSHELTLNLELKRAETVEVINSKLKKAIESGAPDSVITAFEKILVRLNA